MFTGSLSRSGREAQGWPAQLLQHLFGGHAADAMCPQDGFHFRQSEFGRIGRQWSRFQQIP